jgi:hypothetical protein
MFQHHTELCFLSNFDLLFQKGNFAWWKNVQMISCKCFINWFLNLHHKLFIARFDNGNCVKLLFHKFIFLHTNVMHVLDTWHSCAKNMNSWNNKICANFKQIDDHYANMHPSSQCVSLVLEWNWTNLPWWKWQTL